MPELKLSKLIEEVGDANVTFQSITESMTNIVMSKKAGGALITFATDQLTATEVVQQSTKMTGIVLWIPTEKFKEVQEKYRD